MAAALVIRPDGSIVDVQLEAGGDRLEVMRELLGCRLVDVVALTDRLDMWLDDEGMFTRPMNPVATALARRFGFVWQPYYGPVLLAATDSAGGSADLGIGQLRAILALLQDVDEGIGERQ